MTTSNLSPIWHTGQSATHVQPFPYWELPRVARMRVLSRKRLGEFATRHPDTARTLDAWYRAARKAQWETPADIEATFGAVIR
jgi:hypothetical protein